MVKFSESIQKKITVFKENFSANVLSRENFPVDKYFVNFSAVR